MKECECTQDPEFHRDLNIRRNKPEAGDKCTNTILDEDYRSQGGICLGCLFGCYE